MSLKPIKILILLLCLLALAVPTPAKSADETPTPTSTTPLADAFVSIELNLPSLPVGETTIVSVKLNNIPAEGYKSAEFICTYDATLVEKSNIVVTELFGFEPVSAIHETQAGSFIVAIAGANSNRAMTSGTVFTFHAKGLLAAQSQIQCSARVSKGDNLPISLPLTGISLTVLGTVLSPTPMGMPTATPEGPALPTATSMPMESPTPMPSPNGILNGQVLASKPVTVSLLDASNTVISSVIANPDGTFSLTVLAGDYTLLATASGFLSQQGPVNLTAGNTVEKPAIHLLAGDVDGNNVIDQFDALTIGMSYTASTPQEANLNNDGVIDFLDLELLAENFRQMGPTAWE